ncbi:hypothetical protein VP01_3986g1 [Puccinia sorghi]|uniref:Uncharacterized protein n=1 Tax=Puccinia sorghi TaxID=27349 RepID=A0A0L6US55_9BASI|nr:hypothetical protein VP01_3986g1 [Puccinia sorghi]
MTKFRESIRLKNGSDQVASWLGDCGEARGFERVGFLLGLWLKILTGWPAVVNEGGTSSILESDIEDGRIGPSCGERPVPVFLFRLTVGACLKKYFDLFSHVAVIFLQKIKTKCFVCWNEPALSTKMRPQIFYCLLICSTNNCCYSSTATIILVVNTVNKPLKKKFLLEKPLPLTLYTGNFAGDLIYTACRGNPCMSNFEGDLVYTASGDLLHHIAQATIYILECLIEQGLFKPCSHSHIFLYCPHTWSLYRQGGSCAEADQSKQMGGFGFGVLSGHRRRIGWTRVVPEGASGGKLRQWSTRGSGGCTAGGLRSEADAGRVVVELDKEWKLAGIWGCGNSMGAGVAGGVAELWVESRRSFCIYQSSTRTKSGGKSGFKLHNHQKGRTFTVSFQVAVCKERVLDTHRRRTLSYLLSCAALHESDYVAMQPLHCTKNSMHEAINSIQANNLPPMIWGLGLSSHTSFLSPLTSTVPSFRSSKTVTHSNTCQNLAPRALRCELVPQQSFLVYMSLGSYFSSYISWNYSISSAASRWTCVFSSESFVWWIVLLFCLFSVLFILLSLSSNLDPLVPPKILTDLQSQQELSILSEFLASFPLTCLLNHQSITFNHNPPHHYPLSIKLLMLIVQSIIK